jgi:hypothetical protein
MGQLVYAVNEYQGNMQDYNERKCRMYVDYSTRRVLSSGL